MIDGMTAWIIEKKIYWQTAWLTLACRANRGLQATLVKMKYTPHKKFYLFGCHPPMRIIGRFFCLAMLNIPVRGDSDKQLVSIVSMVRLLDWVKYGYAAHRIQKYCSSHSKQSTVLKLKQQSLCCLLNLLTPRTKM